MASNQSQPIALTLGDPCGIGPEIALETAYRRKIDGFIPVLVGDYSAVLRAADALDLPVTIEPIDDFSTIKKDDSIAVFDIGVLDENTLPPYGKVDAKAGLAAVKAIEVATKAAMDEKVMAIVTGPINKESIWASGSKHLGHTEMLHDLTGSKWSDTMFVVRNNEHQLRIFFATRHVSLRKAVEQVRDPNLVFEAIKRADESLRTFNIKNPRLGVAALNPHGGENGSFGDEEIISIGPACEKARAEGLDVAGPIPADSIFHKGLQGQFDGILSLFHDQGHIPSKTVDFDGTISVTVGLPILRTSVDHGTAFDIAGKGIASFKTMASAYEAACEYATFVSNIRKTYMP